jgi:hypothetical protein
MWHLEGGEKNTKASAYTPIWRGKEKKEKKKKKRKGQ